MIPRYRTAEMDALFSEEATLARWTAVELAVCEAWADRGALPPRDLARIRRRAKAPAPARVHAIEATTNHDVVAFVRALAELVGEPAARHLHRGLTSSDVVDTAQALALRAALDVLGGELADLRAALATRAAEHADTPCVGRTHGMHAEPTSFGLVLAGFAAEADRNLVRLLRARQLIATGKLSGAVGNFSQTDPAFEAAVLRRLDLGAEPIATQVVPRDRHAEVLAMLALLGAGLERLAIELRHLQRSEVAEAREPFEEGATGSSAMPHKQNPVGCERITGLARLLRAYAATGFENVALWHERDISHSSVERVVLPDAFHAAHFMTREATRIVRGMKVDPARMRANLEAGGGLVFSQSVLTALVAAGLDRATAYARVQAAARELWEGRSPSFRAVLAADPVVRARLGAAGLAKAFRLERYMKHRRTLLARAGIPRARRSVPDTEEVRRARARAGRRPMGR